MHLLLDWSGTLCDDVATTLRATNAVLVSLGGEAVDLEEYRRDFRLPAHPFYRSRIPAHRDPGPDALEDLFSEALAKEPAPSLFPNARAFVRRALDGGGTARLVSSLPQEELERAVDANGLADLLTAIHGGARDKREVLVRILRDANLPPDDCLMLGDLGHDLDAAHAARVRACAVLHGYASEAELRSHHPDEIWQDLHDAEAWLKRHAALESRAWPIATVGGLVFREDLKAFFVRTPKWSGLWGTPGGKIDYGEGHLEAFAREIHEETGLVATDCTLFLVQDAIEEPEFHKPRHFLLLNLVGRVSGGQERINHESVEGAWFSLEEALGLALNRPTRFLVERLMASAGWWLPTGP